MEQFILGMLQEQLGKVIVGFRKEMVNASLLNGKGEITDLNLNCSFINQQLSAVTPFVELDSVHISKVAFQVTSWTNLRKAPILVDIEHITVHISEPLHYVRPTKKRQRLQQLTESQVEDYFRVLAAECKRLKQPFVNPNKRGGYNLVDRIVDNLCIEIKSLYIQFQTYGKFKTRRAGPWRPPLLQIMLRNLRYCSVDEFGQESTNPDDYWAHNHKPQPRGQQQSGSKDRTLLIFKKVTMDYDFGVTTIEGKQYSLLKGGRGFVPPKQEESPEDKKKEKDNNNTNTSNNPTAAETVATLALGEAVGPAVVQLDQETTNELVAALAFGESSSQSTQGVDTDDDDDDDNEEEIELVQREEEKDTPAVAATTEEEEIIDTSTTNPETTATTKGENDRITKGDDENRQKKEEEEGKSPVITPATSAEAAEEVSSPTKSSADPATKEGENDTDATKEKDDEKNKNSKSDDNEQHDYDPSSNRVEVQMAMKRRIRDGALLALQVDTTLSKVEVQIPAEVVPHLVHVAMGIQYCLSKDRGFNDPLRHENDKSDHNDMSNNIGAQRQRKEKEDRQEEKEGTGDDDEKQAGDEATDKKESKAAQEEANTNNPPAADPKKQEKEEGEDTKITTTESTEDGAAAGDTAAPPQEDSTTETGEKQVKAEGEEGKAAEGGDTNETTTLSAAEKIDPVLLRLPSIALTEDNMSITGEALSVTNTLGGDDSTLGEEGSTVVSQSQSQSQQQLQSVDENKAGFGQSIANFFTRKSVTTESSSAAAAAAAAAAAGVASPTPTTTTTGSSTTAAATAAAGNQQQKEVDRAVIMLPNGLIIHEKISFSVTIERATVRGVYGSQQQQPPPPPPSETKNNSANSSSSVPVAQQESKDDDEEEEVQTKGETLNDENKPNTIDSGQQPQQQRIEQEDYIQIDSNGAVVELIWPKSNLEKGGYAQASVSYMSIQERFGQRIQTLVSSGVYHGVSTGPIEKGSPPPKEVDKDEAFPIFEDRAIREDPLEMRRTYPAQAMGLVARINCETRKKRPEKPTSMRPLPTTITTGDTNNNNNNNDDAASAAASVPNTSQDGSTVLNTSQDESSALNISHDDNPQREEEQALEDVEVIVVTNDLGVDQVNVVLDFDCWCRTLRFLLNDSGGGFDERWNSGDWSKLLTADMLVHPNVPLELDDHLQPLAKFYLDDNEFISSDLFHVNARIQNCETRIPAAIEHNVRSCDIVALIDETKITVSSDLPRVFPSASIGTTFAVDGNSPTPDTTGEIKFPNDPSDVSVELEGGENPSLRQSFMMLAESQKAVKAKSTFRLEFELQRMSTQIVPLIPFYTFSEPQQLMAPTDMTVGFCFEGTPPETDDSNLIKMVLFSSFIVKQMQMNCDLELLAGATSTILHHFHVARETFVRAKQLFPMATTPAEEYSISNRDLSNRDVEDDLSSTLLSSTGSATRIQKSLRGRGILVHRQLHRSRETGGLSLGMFLQVQDYDFILWRQNVTLYRPKNDQGVIDGIERHKIHFPLLKLLSCSAKNIETGIEVSFPEDERRVVVKCGLSDASLSLCDLTGDGAPESTESLSAPDETHGIDLGTEATTSELSDRNPPPQAPAENEQETRSKEEKDESAPPQPSRIKQQESNEEDEKADIKEDEKADIGDDVMLEVSDPKIEQLEASEIADQEARKDDEEADFNCASTKHQAMVDMFRFGCEVPINPTSLINGNIGSNRDKVMLFRLEECFGSCRARSFAADVQTGGIVNLNVDQIESVFLLVFEALMMPTWSKSMSYPLKEKKRFPEKSVGALFHALLPGKGGRFRLLRFLRKLLVLALPQDLRLLLFHIKMAEVLITIPEVEGQYETKLMAQKCALMLRHLDLVTWYISSHDDPFSRNMFPVVADKEGKPWTSLISQEAAGINHRLAGRQSLHVAHILSDDPQEIQFLKLLPEFEVALEYLRGRMSTTMDNTCSLHDKQSLLDCLCFLRRFASRCVDIFFYLKRRLSVLRRREENDEVSVSLTDESNRPISTACSDIEQSIRSVKGMLLRLSEYVDSNTFALNDMVREKEAEVVGLQRLVFAKEKERVAAVALASSPIAGWLRVGGMHQTGMRTSTTSTLWRIWAVLRKGLLILYPAPGKFKPSDVVQLRDAQLRFLAGGKSKWDLKRAFAIVESSGKTRFFVVGSDDEYSSWTAELAKTIQRHASPETAEDVSEEVEVDAAEQEMDPAADDKEQDDKEKMVDDNNSTSKLSMDQDRELVGVGSASPHATTSVRSDQGTPTTESSRFRSKLSGIGSFLKKSKQAPSTPTNDNDNGSGMSVEETTATTDAGESASISQQSDACAGENASPSNGDSRSPQEPNSDNASRRLQLKNKVAGVGGKVASVGGAVGGKVASVGGAVGGKVAGVGQATGRWGSALLAATRQKGRDGTERSRRVNTPTKGEELNTSAHGSLHVITEKEERNWTCPQCTFINSTKETDVEILICAMCESPTEVGTVEFDHPHESAENTALSEPAEKKPNPDVEPNRNRLESAESGGVVFRRQSSEPLEVLRDRLNSADSDPALFPRTQSSENFGGSSYLEDHETSSIISDLAMDEMSDVAGSVGRRRRDRLGGLLGSSRKSRQGRPGEGETEKKGWFSRLGSTASIQDEGDSFLKGQPALKLKNIRINPNMEFTCENTPAINVPLQKLDGKWFVLVAPTTQVAWTAEESDFFISNEGLVNDDNSAMTPRNGSTAELNSARSLVSKPHASKEQLFQIQIFHRGTPDDRKQPRSTVIRSFSDIVSFHNVVSECIVDLIHHPLFYEKSFERTNDGDMSAGLKNLLGLSPLDSVRISGAFLAGIVDAISSNPPVDVPSTRNAEAVMEFLNSTLDCPLSSTAHFALTEFLGISSARSIEVLSPSESLFEGTTDEMDDLIGDNDLRVNGDTTFPAMEGREDTTKSIDTAMTLSSQCMAELLKAEQHGKLATDLLNVASTPFDPLSLQSPLLPNHVTENLQSAMHVALMKVMAERDEAHAQLVSASVLHAHNLEQERKKVERLEAKLELANKMAQRPAIPRFGLDRKKAQEEEEEREKLQKKQMDMQQNSDAEIVALCEQLSGEISSRTQAALEVIRLKESRTIERKHEMEEKDALRNELIRAKEMLSLEQKKAQDAKQEAERWKQCYERAASSDHNG